MLAFSGFDLTGRRRRGRWLVLTAVSLIASGLPAAAQTPSTSAAPRPNAVAFTGVTVVDVRTGRLLAERTVIVRGRRIAAVGPSGRVRVPAGVPVVAARGQYLIPGLWDMHVHQSPGDVNWDISHPLLIVNGITGVRDAWTPHLDSALQLRRAIAAGRRVGPREVIAGPALIDDSVPPNLASGQATVITAAQARRAVDSLQAAGADFIKTRIGRRELPESEQVAQVERETYFAAVAEARRLGIRFEGHLPGGVVSLTTAADSGQRIIDHEYFGVGYCWTFPQAYPHNAREVYRRLVNDTAGPAACRRLATHLRAHNAWIMPNLHGGASCRWPEEDSTHWGLAKACPDSSFTHEWEWQRTVAQLAMRIGLPVLAGTDATGPFDYGNSLHRELAALVAVGMTPLQALQTATLNPALAYEATDSLGTVERGKLADLVLLDADPLVDIRNTTRIRAVVANGRYFDRAALDRLLAEARQAAAQAEAQRGAVPGANP